jgi:ABC-type branched-subunit amino acid transport system ATPase component
MSLTNSTVAVRFENVSRHFGTVRAVDNVTSTLPVASSSPCWGPPARARPPASASSRALSNRHPATSRFSAKRPKVFRPIAATSTPCFQDYALFPHMNVLDNVSYGLMVKGMAREAAPRQGGRPRWPRQARRLRRTPARAALGRPASARRPRPCPCQRAVGPFAR